MLDYKIIFEGKPVLKNTSFSENLSKDLQNKISNFWDHSIKPNKPDIFNDKVLRFVKICPNNEVEVAFTDYKTIIVSRTNPKLKLNIPQVGVSGIIIVNNDNSNFILFSKRTKNTTEYPNFYELVPSGNLDMSVLNNDNTINYESKIIQEFEEETGLSKNSLQKVVPFCFVKDNINGVFDVCCILEISLNNIQLSSSFQKTSEYDIPLLIPFEDLDNFVQKNLDQIVPTSKAILECFLKND